MTPMPDASPAAMAARLAHRPRPLPPAMTAPAPGVAAQSVDAPAARIAPLANDQPAGAADSLSPVATATAPLTTAPIATATADPPAANPGILTAPTLSQPADQPVPDPGALWAALGGVALDPAMLERSLVITAARSDPAHGAFDVLRTRLLGALADKGWTRVGITSPTKGCGKSFSAMNLAVSLARYDARRTILMDMDMRMPSLARSLGVVPPGSMGDVLRGLTPPSRHLLRVAPNGKHIGNLALGLNTQPELFAAELFQQESTAVALAAIQADYRPDVMLFDLPPALAQDDVIAFRAHVDCILMVVGGGITTAREVREVVRRLGEDKPVVGVILNKAEGLGVGEYAY